MESGKRLDELRKVVREAIAPYAAEIDEKEVFPERAWRRLAKGGFCAMPIGAPYGSGESTEQYAEVVCEIAKACASTAVILSTHTSLCESPIEQFGTEEQKKRFLPGLASGEVIGAFGLTEPSAGSDVLGIKTTAKKDGSSYSLNGEKIFITNAGHAGLYLIFADTGGEGAERLSAFLVPVDTPGFSVAGYERKMGIRGSTAGHLLFSDCRIPEENLLGQPGQGFQIAMKTLDFGRISIAAQACGIAQGAIDAAAAYTAGRCQFEKPISKFQNTKFELAELQTNTRAAWLLVKDAAVRREKGRAFSKEAAMAKLFASENAMNVTQRCLQLFGGYGYTKRYPVERMMRDAKITELYEGTSEVQKIVISSVMEKEREGFHEV